MPRFSSQTRIAAKINFLVPSKLSMAAEKRFSS